MASLLVVVLGFAVLVAFGVWLFRREASASEAEPEPVGGLHITTLDGRGLRAASGLPLRRGGSDASFVGGGDSGGGGCGGDGGGGGSC